MTKEEFVVIAPSIPHSPGVYKYYDSNKKILYVGKAKDLRKRVSSYFNKNVSNNKTQVLVAQIKYIEFTVTDTEHDAFLLENSLIKYFQPRYNIELKDDKSYPYIVIKNESYPRVFMTRTLVKDGSEYIGPFTSVKTARELLELINIYIPLRSCSLNLSPKNIEKGKFKVCLEYHLGNCLGPCEGLQSLESYNEKLQLVRHILKGNLKPIISDLKNAMQWHANKLEFEKAAQLKQKLDALKQYQQKSIVANTKLTNLDVISIVSEENCAFVNFMMIQNGSIINTKTILIDKKLNEDESYIISIAYLNFRKIFNSNATEVITPIHIDLSIENVCFKVPRVGDRRKILEMSLKNAYIFKDEVRYKKSLMIEQTNSDKQEQILFELQKILNLKELPTHIECFDNSNFQGSFPVAAMVCFKNGLASTDDYRHYKIKTVKGIDDFASMEEVVYRRYKRLIDENKKLPQLVIIDGGKGQLNAAMKSISKLELENSIALIGLAKREESIFFPMVPTPLQLSYDNKAHLLIRQIRDEVHRFGITFHRNLRSKGTIKNELETIKGIGEKIATDLLREFKSINKIKTLTERELTRVIGAKKALLVWNFYHQNE